MIQIGLYKGDMMPDSFREFVNQSIQYVPFMAMTTGGRPTMNFARIIETLIIAAIVGLIANYMTVQKLSEKMNSMNDKITKLERTTDKLFSDIYKPFLKELSND